MKIKFLPITLIIMLSMILGACTPAAAPTPETIVVKETVVNTVVEKEIVEVEVVQTAVPVEPVAPVANPYRPERAWCRH